MTITAPGYQPQWFTCGVCGMYRQGEPPHGNLQPCPEKLKVDSAYMEMLDAQKQSYLNANFALNDIAAANLRMAREISPDDE